MRPPPGSGATPFARAGEPVMKVAVAAPPVGPTTPAARLAWIERVARAARDAEAGLLVLPELVTAGDRPATELRALAELSDGPTAERLGAIARASGVALAVGYPELCTGQLYSSALLIDARGNAVANYRRTHLETDEAGTIAKGQWMGVTPLGGRRVGLLIGCDIEPPEAARGLVLSGADLLAVLGGRAAPSRRVLDILLPARALENGVALAYAGRRNSEPGTVGEGRILGPDGEDLPGRHDPQAGLRVAFLPPPAAQPSSRLRCRRPRLYQRLAHIDVAARPGATS